MTVHRRNLIGALALALGVLGTLPGIGHAQANAKK